MFPFQGMHPKICNDNPDVQHRIKSIQDSLSSLLSILSEDEKKVNSILEKFRRFYNIYLDLNSTINDKQNEMDSIEECGDNLVEIQRQTTKQSLFHNEISQLQTKSFSMNEIAKELISEIKSFGRIRVLWYDRFGSGSEAIAFVEKRTAEVNSNLDRLTKASLSKIENLKHAERLLNLKIEKHNLLKLMEKLIASIPTTINFNESSINESKEEMLSVKEGVETFDLKVSY